MNNLIQDVLLKIETVPKEFFFIALFFMVFFTCLAILPSNNDVLLLALGIFTARPDGQYNPTIAYLIYLIAILSGENVMFLIGRIFGQKLVNTKFVTKKFSAKQIHKLKITFQKFPKRFIFSIRMTPVFRPLFYSLLGTFGPNWRDFFIFHFFLTIPHTLAMFSISYFGSSFMMIHFKEFLPVFILFLVSLWLVIIMFVRKGIKNQLQITDIK